MALGGSPAADYGTRLWAHVSGNGATRGYGVKSVSNDATGAYAVTFDRSVARCAAFATISADNQDYTGYGYPGIGMIEPSLVIAPGVENVIAVRTTLPDGVTPADYDFNLMVLC
jgi:hypothetical protein